MKKLFSRMMGCTMVLILLMACDSNNQNASQANAAVMSSSEEGSSQVAESQDARSAIQCTIEGKIDHNQLT